MVRLKEILEVSIDLLLCLVLRQDILRIESKVVEVLVIVCECSIIKVTEWRYCNLLGTYLISFSNRISMNIINAYLW